MDVLTTIRRQNNAGIPPAIPEEMLRRSDFTGFYLVAFVGLVMLAATSGFLAACLWASTWPMP